LFFLSGLRKQWAKTARHPPRWNPRVGEFGIGVSQKRPTNSVSASQPQLRRSFCYWRGLTLIKRETNTRKSHKLHLAPKQDRSCLPFLAGAAWTNRCPPTNSFPPVRRRLSITLATRACSLLMAQGNR